MKGLIRKELYLVGAAGLLRTYLILLGIFVGGTILGLYERGMAIMAVAVVLGMIPTTLYFYDEAAGWNTFVSAAPAGRDGLVQGKYAAILVIDAAVLVLLFVWNLLTCAVDRGQTLADGAVASILGVAVGMLADSVTLPVMFKFGSQKGRVIMRTVVIAAIIAATGGLAAAKGSLSEAQIGPMWVVFAVAFSAVVFYISFRLSLVIYTKKEL